eukprot:1537073-Rhodomonas_salina.1
MGSKEITSRLFVPETMLLSLKSKSNWHHGSSPAAAIISTLRSCHCAVACGLIDGVNSSTKRERRDRGGMSVRGQEKHGKDKERSESRF